LGIPAEDGIFDQHPASSEGLFVIEIQVPASQLQQQNQQKTLRACPVAPEDGTGDLCAFAVPFFCRSSIINIQ